MPKDPADLNQEDVEYIAGCLLVGMPDSDYPEPDESTRDGSDVLLTFGPSEWRITLMASYEG